jgi:hypothetical protein
MDETPKPATDPKPTAPTPSGSRLKWAFEKDFVTDTGSGIALRLERHVDKKPTQYRYSFGALIRQTDNSLKFILGLRPWIDRRGGRVTVRDESAIMMLLMQRMQEYLAEKEQLAEDEWQKNRPGKGIKQWGRRDKERREARDGSGTHGEGST